MMESPLADEYHLLAFAAGSTSVSASGPGSGSSSLQEGSAVSTSGGDSSAPFQLISQQQAYHILPSMASMVGDEMERIASPLPSGVSIYGDLSNSLMLSSSATTAAADHDHLGMNNHDSESIMGMGELNGSINGGNQEGGGGGPDSLAGDSEDKRNRRLIRNREAAKRNRLKKKDWIQNLQRANYDAKDVNIRLKARLAQLEEEYQRIVGSAPLILSADDGSVAAAAAGSEGREYSSLDLVCQAAFSAEQLLQ